MNRTSAVILGAIVVLLIVVGIMSTSKSARLDRDNRNTELAGDPQDISGSTGDANARGTVAGEETNSSLETEFDLENLEK